MNIIKKLVLPFPVLFVITLASCAIMAVEFIGHEQGISHSIIEEGPVKIIGFSDSPQEQLIVEFEDGKQGKTTNFWALSSSIICPDKHLKFRLFQNGSVQFLGIME